MVRSCLLNSGGSQLSWYSLPCGNVTLVCAPSLQDLLCVPPPRRWSSSSPHCRCGMVVVNSWQQAFFASEKSLEIEAQTAHWLPPQLQPCCLTHVPRLAWLSCALGPVCLECLSLFLFFTSFPSLGLSPQQSLACSPEGILLLLSFSFLAVLGIEPMALHMPGKR